MTLIPTDTIVANTVIRLYHGKEGGGFGYGIGNDNAPNGTVTLTAFKFSAQH